MSLKDVLWSSVLGAARTTGWFARGTVDGGRYAVRLLARDRGPRAAGSAARRAPRVLKTLLERTGRSNELGEIALGVAVASGLAVGESLYAHPGVQATVRSSMRSFLGQDPEHHDGAVAAEHACEVIVGELGRRGLRPVRLAVDGLPGSGKTTLAQKLATQLGLEHMSLEHTDMTRPQDLSRRGIVVEHHRLLRTQELDGFDALVYLDLPVREVLGRLHRRERGGYLAALFDFERMKRIGDLAFHTCAGEVLNVGGGVRLKLRPPEGYLAAEKLGRLARARGLEGIGSLTREEVLFFVANGRAREGLRAYLNEVELRRQLEAAAVAALEFLAARRRG